MVISEIIDMRKNKPQIIKHIKLAADKELLVSFPLAIKFIIKTPNIIIKMTVPNRPPSPPHSEGIQNM